METAQLAYFMLACQFRNHAQAAAYSRVSPSTISENITALERELGLTLFQRGAQGHYPTEAARWLYQSVEPLLQAVEVAGIVAAQPGFSSLRYLDVTSPLQLMVGQLARSTSLALRAVMRSMPGVVGRAHFALSRPPYIHVLDGESHCVDRGNAGVVLNYASNVDDPQGVVILRDEWVSLSSMPARKPTSDDPVTFDELRDAPLYLPPLGEAQLAQIRQYCALHQLPMPRVIEEDVGTFARLAQEQHPFHMLAPRSLVAASVARSSLLVQSLPIALSAVIVAQFAKQDRIAACFVAHLRRIMDDENPVVAYQPAISHKQLRYFLAVSEQLTMTAAAKQLHVAQPALSSQISKLEATLGVPLFQRSRKGLIALPSAHRLGELIRPAMTACESIIAGAAYYAAMRKERLTFGVIPCADHAAPLALALARTIAQWSSLYPNVRLQIVEGEAETLRRWVDSGEVGIALVDTSLAHGRHLNLAIADTLGVISNARRPLLTAGNIDLREALTLPLALPGPLVGLRQTIDKAALAMAQQVSPAIEVNSPALILALVRQMPIASIVPASAVSQAVADGAVQFNPITAPRLTRHLSILCSGNRCLTRIEHQLIDLLRTQLQDGGITGAAQRDDAIAARMI